MAKVGPKNGEREGGGLQECYVIFKGGTAKCYEVLQGGGGVNFALKKRYVIVERPLRSSAICFSLSDDTVLTSSRAVTSQ